ncbi:hypothetical protein GH5_07966 [Leishmania sp. Ghana 2012 LV757]|uniref:hypothetical protein n=1 Tax=Leishmania sp. Ghana 2012 LV757 TaxID=2803181 RepID=UPI001B54BF0F|nr:hypothetical protein GH5_07966 [Leishmania sp. Ghana 2012 LV757]
MEPRWGLHNSQPLRIPVQYPAGLSSAAPSSSAAAGPRVSHSASIISTQPLNAAAAASPPPIPLPYSSLRLLQEIEETRKLLRTFRSLKERGASRAELADLHSRVKALKAAQKFQQKHDAGSCNKLTLPVATSTALDAAAAIAQPSFVCSTRASPPSSYARHHAGVALQGEAAGRTVGSSSSSHQPQPQKPRGVVEAHATHRDGQLHEGRHHRRHRHEVHVNPVPSLPISTSLSTVVAQVSTSVHNGVSNHVSSSNAGTQSAAALRPNGVSSVAGSIVQLNSIVFAVALAEAHMRREIAHRWERRWLRHWASFKEERIAIALCPSTTLMAARLRPQLLPERWAEASPMVLPCERPQWQQSKPAAVSSAEVTKAAAVTKAHISEASLAPAPGWSTGEALTAPTSSHAHSGLEQRSLLSAGGGGGESRQAAESHREEIPNVDGPYVEENVVVCAGPFPQHQPQPAAPITQRNAGASSCPAADAAAFSGVVSSEEAAASAAERLAAALRSIEDDEAAARIATESAAAVAEEAWKAVQSLAVAEARARVALEGDEACSRASHAEAERYGAERAAFAAAEVAARRSAQEEKKRHAAAARVAAADAEAAERCSIEQQWQADVRLTESLLAGWIRDAVATDLQSARSKDKSALERPLRDEATMENVQARETAEAQADLCERHQALEQCVAAFSAATDTVFGELTSAAAAEAVAQQRQAEQAAAAEAARRRREEEEAAARAEAVEQERAYVAARAALLWAEEKGRNALVASEERAWQLQQEAAGVEVMYLATEEQARRRAERAEDAARVKAEKEVAEDAIRLAAVEEAARLQVEHRAAAAGGQLECDAAKAREAAAAVLTATLCSAVTDLSKNLVDSCLAEATQQARKQGEAAVALAARDRAAAEERQMEWREKIEDEEALARDEMRGDALGELERLRNEEAAAEVRKRIVVETMASVKELERQQQQQQTCRRAAAQCLYLSEWCDALLLDLLHDAASTAVSMVECKATVANGRASEAPPPAALPEREESEANAFMENEPQHHHPPFTGEGTEGPSALTEEVRVDGVDRLGKASLEAAAEEVAAAIASPPLSPSSSAGPSSFFMDSVSADAKPGAVTTDALKGHTDEYLRLMSPAAFVRLVDGLLSDILHDAAIEARKGGSINEAIANQTGAAHRSMRHRMPVLDGSDASLASIDSGGSWSSSVRSPPQALQLRPLALPSPFMVSTGVAGDHVQQVPHTSDESNDSAKVDVVGGTGSATWSPAAVTVDDRASHRCTVSPLLISPVDVNATNAAALSTASAAGVKERISATGAATAASSPLHCFSTASSADDDDDAACRSFTAPEAPLPLHLRQRSVLFPLLSQRPDSGEVTTPAGSGEGDKDAAADTMTGTALAHRFSSSGKRETRQQPHGNPVTSDRDPTSGADGRPPAVTMAGSAMGGITEDLRAFQLDAPSPPHGESEHRVEEGIAPAYAFSVDAVAAAAASLVDRIVHDATLVAASRGQSVAAGTDRDREEARDGVKAGHAAASPSLFSSAQGHAQSTAEGKLRHNGSSASTSCCSNGSDGSGLASARIGGDELHAEKRVSGAESIPGITSADTREAALRVSRASSLAAAAVAAEGITGAHSSLASLSTLVSAVAAPNHFATHLRQQEAEKKAVAHQQNRYLTHRELALVAARYLTSEAAAAHVMEIGPTATLSARAVALVLSVGLVRAATLENRRARCRVEETGRGGSGSTSGGGTSGAGALAEEKESPKLTQDSGAASAAMNSPSAWMPSMSGNGARDGFPIGTIGKAGQERGNDEDGGVDMPPGSPSTRCHGGGGGFGPIGPAAPSAIGCAKRGNGSGACSLSSPAAPVPTPSTESGEVKEADMSGSLMSRGSPSLSQQVSSSSGPASQPPAYGGEKGALASSAAQLQVGVRDKLPADWATALRGVAERIAHDFIDYTSRCVLLGQGEGHSHQDDLRTARCIHSDALARIDVQALFTHELQLRDVARLTYYNVELATNGPRDRVDPHGAPAVLGEHNMFGRRSRGDVEGDGNVAATSRLIDVGNEDAPGFDHLDSSSTGAPAPLARHQCPSPPPLLSVPRAAAVSSLPPRPFTSVAQVCCSWCWSSACRMCFTTWSGTRWGGFGPLTCKRRRLKPQQMGGHSVPFTTSLPPLAYTDTHPSSRPPLPPSQLSSSQPSRHLHSARAHLLSIMVLEGNGATATRRQRRAKEATGEEAANEGGRRGGGADVL